MVMDTRYFMEKPGILIIIAPYIHTYFQDIYNLNFIDKDNKKSCNLSFGVTKEQIEVSEQLKIIVLEEPSF